MIWGENPHFRKPPYGLAGSLPGSLRTREQKALRIWICVEFLNICFFPSANSSGSLWRFPRLFCGGAVEEQTSFGCSPRLHVDPKKIHGNPSKMPSTYQKWLQQVCHDSRPKISCQTFMYNAFSSWGQRIPSDASEYEVLLVLAVSILKHKHT